MGREEELAYANEHGIPVKGGSENKPYSIDDNIWGRSSEGKWIEELGTAPEEDVFQLATRPEAAPHEQELLEHALKEGVTIPVTRQHQHGSTSCRTREMQTGR